MSKSLKSLVNSCIGLGCERDISVDENMFPIKKSTDEQNKQINEQEIVDNDLYEEFKSIVDLNESANHENSCSQNVSSNSEQNPSILTNNPRAMTDSISVHCVNQQQCNNENSLPSGILCSANIIPSVEGISRNENSIDSASLHHNSDHVRGHSSDSQVVYGIGLRPHSEDSTIYGIGLMSSSEASAVYGTTHLSLMSSRKASHTCINNELPCDTSPSCSVCRVKVQVECVSAVQKQPKSLDNIKSLWSSLVTKKSKQKSKNSKDSHKRNGFSMKPNSKQKSNKCQELDQGPQLNLGCTCCSFATSRHNCFEIKSRDCPVSSFTNGFNSTSNETSLHCTDMLLEQDRSNSLSLEGHACAMVPVTENLSVLPQGFTTFDLHLYMRNLQVERFLRNSLEPHPQMPVHTQMNYIHCLVPDLLTITNCGFYWGKMDRYEAERLIENKPEGTFLLRDSAQEDYLFSVSFCRHKKSLHARIEQSNRKFSFDPLDPGVFSSDTVCGLLEFYKDPSCCMFYDPVLTNPLPRTFPFPLQHLCRATICSNITYNGINKLRLPKTLKNYLKEYHYKQRVSVTHWD